MTQRANSTQPEVLLATQRWVQRWVIGQGLCPFAREPWHQKRVRIVVHEGDSLDSVVDKLSRELVHLHQTPREQIETTLLVTPRVLTDFLDFNDFLEVAHAVLVAHDLQSEYQIPNFHQQYCFEQTAPSDRANHSNRSPYPMLQLLRQVSVNEGLVHYADPSSIYRRNIEHLRNLDETSWQALQKDPPTGA